LKDKYSRRPEECGKDRYQSTGILQSSTNNTESIEIRKAINRRRELREMPSSFDNLTRELLVTKAIKTEEIYR